MKNNWKRFAGICSPGRHNQENRTTDNVYIQKKRLLIYAHYYVPDVAATGQILRDLAEGISDTFAVTVICVVPSYGGVIEEKYKKKKYTKETINGVEVLRIRVPEFEKTDKRSRIKNILGYFWGAVGATFHVGPQDYVFSISQPPILSGLLGVWGKWLKHAKYIYNIQDFNPEQVIAVGYSKNKLALRLMMLLDKFNCKKSDLVIMVGRDMVETMKKRFKGEKLPKTVLINNWIDEKKIYPLEPQDQNVEEFRNRYGLEGKFVIMYSGNIGLYYDLEELIKVLKQFRKGYTSKGVWEDGPVTADGREVAFVFVGAGALLDKLKSYARKHRFENIIFIPYQDMEKLIYSLNAADVHWCVSAKGIKGVSVPSKCYGIMAVGRPMLGVLEEGTEVRYLIEEAACGRCCEPGDYEGIADAIRWFIERAGTEELKVMGENGRRYLTQNLAQKVSVEKYRKEILEC